jgi:hypothetical protein
MSFAPGRSSVLGSVKSFVTLVAIVVLGFAALAAYMTFGQPKAATPAADTSTVGSAVHSATPVAAPAAEAAVAVEKVKSSEGSARQVLVKDYGVTCTVASHLSIAVPADLPESIDAKVAQAKLSGDGWADKETWVGSAATAAQAFNAKAAFDDGFEVRIVQELPGGVQARNLFSVKTPSGKVAWSLFESVTACP